MHTKSKGIGRPVLVTYTGSNPSAAAVTINKAGFNTADTVGASEMLIIQAFELIAETGGVVLVSGGTGAKIAAGKLPASGGGIAQNNIERRCIKGTTPTVTAASGGVVDFNAQGFIIAVP